MVTCEMTMMALTLDSSAKPIELVPVKDAVAQIASDMISPGPDTFQVLAKDETVRFRSMELDIPAPVIVLFRGYVELGKADTRIVNRRVLFARDKFTCQYCGYQPAPGKAIRELTIDHVKPIHLHRNRAEATTWENCVTSCGDCNTKKGGKLPRVAGMLPRITPVQPHYVQLRFAGRLNEIQRNYVADYFSDDLAQSLHL